MGLQLAMGAQALLIPSVPPPVVQMISPRHVLHDRAPSAFPGGATLFLADDEEDGGSGGLSLDGLIPSIDSLMPSSEPEPAAAPSSSSVGLPEKLMGDFGRLGSALSPIHNWQKLSCFFQVGQKWSRSKCVTDPVAWNIKFIAITDHAFPGKWILWQGLKCCKYDYV